MCLYNSACFNFYLRIWKITKFTFQIIFLLKLLNVKLYMALVGILNVLYSISESERTHKRVVIEFKVTESTGTLMCSFLITLQQIHVQKKIIIFLFVFYKQQIFQLVQQILQLIFQIQFQEPFTSISNAINFFEVLCCKPSKKQKSMQ